MAKDDQLGDQLEDLFSDIVPPEPTVTPEQPAEPVAAETPQATESLFQSAALLRRESDMELRNSYADLPSSSPADSDQSSSPDKTLWQQAVEYWLTIPVGDPDVIRKGRLFNGLLILSLIFTLAVAGVVGVTLLSGTSLPAAIGLSIPGGGLTVSLISLALLRRGQVNVSIWFYTLGIFAVSLAAAFVNPLSSAIPLYFLWPIAVAGLLLEPIYALRMALVTTGATIALFALQQSDVYRPLIVLPQNQEALLNLANWTVTFITIGVTIYIVLRSLNRTLQHERTLRAELAAQQDVLSQQVAERTHLLQEANYQLQKRAIQLEAGVEISRATASILDPQELMQSTVDLIRTRFNYYHVTFFLLDETREWAIAQASTGKVGQQMVDPRTRHRLAVGGQSMVGWVCAHSRPRVALDVGADAVHFDHPLLPHTRSEIVLPLRVGDRLLGALDAQSAEEAAFDDDDLRTLQGMADMVAVALDNARLFAATRRSVRQQQLVTRITERLQQATSLADILSLTAADLGETFDLAQATVCLGTAAEFQNPPRFYGTPVQDTE